MLARPRLRLLGAEPSVDRVAKPLVACVYNILESGAVHTRVDPSWEDSLLLGRDVIPVVQQTPERSQRQEESVATTAHVSSQVGPPASTISHRFPRSAHNKPRFAVPIGKKE